MLHTHARARAHTHTHAHIDKHTHNLSDLHSVVPRDAGAGQRDAGEGRHSFGLAVLESHAVGLPILWTLQAVATPKVL